MAAPSKSSQKAKNVVLGLLLLWSFISLIIIVVWSTSPCKEGREGSRVVWNKSKEALEEKLEREKEKVERKTAELLVLEGHLNATNTSLEEYRQENVILNRNISVLLENVEQLREMEANLTAQLSQLEDHSDALQNNLTQAFHQTEACNKLKDAAHSQMLAANSQTKACESQQQYLQKRLLKCKGGDSDAAPSPSPLTTHDKTPVPSIKDHSAPPPLAGIPALMLLVCSALHLIT
ncbi:tropomyosin-1, isoforms 33/34 [Trachinotus anak]|uniref:tropomyosin-1, isoforms 33/34 n=1 Tax=Trachinotus anak TaxID=443729 RepID=UPI0039F25F8E